jgi:hypothetical protein
VRFVLVLVGMEFKVQATKAELMEVAVAAVALLLMQRLL